MVPRVGRTCRTLKDLGLAHDNRLPLPAGALRLGRLTHRYDLALPFEKALTHLAIFGPPGSGKSSSFIMSMAKDWARNGSAIFLDPERRAFQIHRAPFQARLSPRPGRPADV